MRSAIGAVQVEPAERIRRDELGSIQFLRFVASTLVVLFHTEVQLYRLSGGTRQSAVPFAAYGTDLFFVISGFIMVYITFGGRQTFSDFMMRRVRRIVPLYWIYMTAFIVLWLGWRSAFNSSILELHHVLASFFFVPYPHPVLGITQPLMPVGWTLNYYMYFYLIFAACLPLRPRLRVAAVSSVLLCVVLLRYVWGSGAVALSFYGSPIVLEFVYGMLAALALLAVPTMPRPAILTMLVVAVAIFILGVRDGASESENRVIFWGVSATFLLMGCVAYERRSGWFADGLSQRLGNASYSIFLSNLFSLGAMGLLFRYMHLYDIAGGEAVQFLLLFGALGFGYLAHVIIERPVIAYLGARHGSRRQRRAASAEPSRQQTARVDIRRAQS